MAGDAEKFSMPIGPPRLAHALLTLLTGAADKAALIGDLEEEFGQRSRTSLRAARAWYWRQASLSLPYLLLERMRSERVRRLGIAVLAVLAGFVFMSLWEINVARNLARGFAELSQTPSYTAIRVIYIGVQMIGVAAAGGVIAALIFRRDEPFLRNALYRLTPAALVLFAPWIIALVNPAENYPQSFLIIRLSLAAPSLVAGAWTMSWWLSRRAP